MLTRRRLLAASGAAAIAATVPSWSATAASIDSLGELAAARGILFGASFATHELDRPYGARYAEIYERDARILTSELELKLSALRPTADTLDFAAADRLCDFAGHRGLQIRGHTLIWNDDVPDWVKRLSPSEAGQLLDTHIMTVMERYRDRIRIWDVVNEPIGPWDNKPGDLRDGPFYAAFGESYIARAFRAAREHAAGATLVLNEAQTETDDANGARFRASFLALLKRLKADGAPIDAIGIESHLKAAAPYDYAAFGAYLQEIADLGYEIHITELDVNDTGVAGPISARDATVADIYYRYLTAVLKVPAVKVVQLWQLADPTSWMRDPVTARKLGMRAKARPLIYDEAFKRKPSWDAIAKAFNQALIR